jgi:hypothetical protein
LAACDLLQDRKGSRKLRGKRASSAQYLNLQGHVGPAAAEQYAARKRLSDQVAAEQDRQLRQDKLHHGLLLLAKELEEAKPEAVAAAWAAMPAEVSAVRRVLGLTTAGGHNDSDAAGPSNERGQPPVAPANVDEQQEAQQREKDAHIMSELKGDLQGALPANHPCNAWQRRATMPWMPFPCIPALTPLLPCWPVAFFQGSACTCCASQNTGKPWWSWR